MKWWGATRDTGAKWDRRAGHFSGYWKRAPIVAIATARTQLRPGGFEMVSELTKPRTVLAKVLKAA